MHFGSALRGGVGVKTNTAGLSSNRGKSGKESGLLAEGLGVMLPRLIELLADRN